MTPTQRQALAWVKRAVTERLAELHEQWQNSDDAVERETLHAKTRATIELEDKLSARIREYSDE